eukprot:m.193116 g.193116  ORF g.193116 m.193116 type:complete len:114 (+) comp16776_c10_seq8:1174-1515(+)
MMKHRIIVVIDSPHAISGTQAFSRAIVVSVVAVLFGCRSSIFKGNNLTNCCSCIKTGDIMNLVQRGLRSTERTINNNINNRSQDLSICLHHSDQPTVNIQALSLYLPPRLCIR